MKPPLLLTACLFVACAILTSPEQEREPAAECVRNPYWFMRAQNDRIVSGAQYLNNCEKAVNVRVAMTLFRLSEGTPVDHLRAEIRLEPHDSGWLCGDRLSGVCEFPKERISAQEQTQVGCIYDAVHLASVCYTTEAWCFWPPYPEEPQGASC